MKCLSLDQPHATACAIGIKRYETRARRTNHRGWFAIQATARPFDPAELPILGPAWEAVAARVQTLTGWPDPFPTGRIVCVARLVDDHATADLTLASRDAPFGDFSPGRRAYELADARFLPLPLPCRGMPGWFALDPATVAAIHQQLGPLAEG